MTAAALKRELKAAGSPAGARGSARFFKTGKGKYAEGDVFLGVSTPSLRKIVSNYKKLNLDELQLLVAAKEHECRAAALEILVSQHKAGDKALRTRVLKFYLRNTRYINNWDLVDMSAGEIVGSHLHMRSTKALVKKLARSKDIWERRIAIIATMPLARRGQLSDALLIAERLLDDTHDLIHKATGWVLRIVGDSDAAVLLGFLKDHYDRVPRTTLRYAIEHFPPNERKKMLAGEFAIES